MPLPRLLLPLCGLLLAVAVTAATAAAPVYVPGDIRVTSAYSYGTLVYSDEVLKCMDRGGSLVPMVTDAVYNLVKDEMMRTQIASVVAAMGGSSMLSSSACTTQRASLDCIWYWDQGRYTGINNVIPFYRGNRGPQNLTGAGMLGAMVRSYWAELGPDETCPCVRMQRYGAVIYENNENPRWIDTSATNYSYGSASNGDIATLCAIELHTTSTRSTTTTRTTTTAPPTTRTTRRPTTTTVTPAITTADPSEGNSEVSVPLVVGVSVGTGVMLIVIVGILVSVLCCGDSPSLPGKPEAAPASSADSELRLGNTSRSSSFKSRSSDTDTLGSRSFHRQAPSKNGSSRSFNSRSSSRYSRSSDTSTRGRRSSHDDAFGRKGSSRSFDSRSSSRYSRSSDTSTRGRRSSHDDARGRRGSSLSLKSRGRSRYSRSSSSNSRSSDTSTRGRRSSHDDSLAKKGSSRSSALALENDVASRKDNEETESSAST